MARQIRDARRDQGEHAAQRNVVVVDIGNEALISL